MSKAAASVEGLEQFVPDLPIKSIPDESHPLVYEHPEGINGYEREFITDQRSVASGGPSRWIQVAGQTLPTHAGYKSVGRPFRSIMEPSP